ncbi:S-layer homology domain-containing protein [Candidatus Peregrinibacteria bacterium]|nr:S-layer homology domain-containing protein [Candidatus Peregrinibacteria bacterium]
MKKIVFSIVGTATLFTSLAVFAFGGAGFNDLQGSEWYYGAANFARDHGFIKGTNGNFAPGKSVTRDQIAVMLEKFAYNVHFQPGPQLFRDPWYGFSLSFPENWRGYLYETQHPSTVVKPSGEATPLTNYNFGLLNNDGKFENLMTVGVWIKSEWNKAKNEGGGYFTLEKLGEKGNYVATYSASQDSSEELQEPREWVSEVKKTFSWE